MRETPVTRASASKSRQGDGNALFVALRHAIAELKSLPSSADSVTLRERRLSVLAAFEAAWPDLARRGQLFRWALRLPLAEIRAEPVVKALLLLLSRRLREQRGNLLPSSELPYVPLFLQRLGVADHALFDDFCHACRKSWPCLVGEHGEFDRLSRLLRGAEDYALIHQTRGTALGRLTSALTDSLQDERLRPEETLHSAAVCGLARAVLEVRARSICSPLLAALQTSLIASVEHINGADADPKDVFLLLIAAAELQAAAATEPSVSTSLRALLGHAKGGVAKWGDHLFVNKHSTAMFLRACGFTFWSSPDETHELLLGWVDRVQVMKSAPEKAGGVAESALRFGCHLPTALRRLLAERLATVVAKAGALDDRALSVRLALLHDLPFWARGNGDAEGALKLARQAEALLAQMFETAENAAAHQPRTRVWAYVVADNCAECLKSIDGEETSEVVSSLTRLAELAFWSLNACWSEMTEQDVQVLFRTNGNATRLVAAALGNIAHVRSLGVQISILHATASISSVQELERAGQSLLSSLERTGRVELCAAESSLMRGPLARVGAQKLQSELLAELRRRLFRDTLSAKPIWCHTPSRGFVEYVQRCSDRGREAWQAARTSAAGS